jgi:peptide chain release factor 2
MCRKCEVIFDVDNREHLLAGFEAQSAAPNFWDDPNKAKTIIDQANAHRSVLAPYRDLQKAIQDVELLLSLAAEEQEESQRQMAFAEASASLGAAEKSFERLEFQSLLNGELDPNNAYLTLHAGAGGTESCDWVDMLFRMYWHYCEDRGFNLELMESQPGEEAGLKRVTFLVGGPYAYGYLKGERGVHRLVRISPFDANKRRHTTFAALDVVAEVSDDLDVEIAEGDLKVDTYRSSGAGGQHVNKTDSAIRITHIPTGIVVACQAERSQHKNRSKAMKMLRAKVYELMRDQKKKELERFYSKKGEIAWGNQIRSYVMQPYTMVKDHRTGVETGNVNAVLDGDLEAFVEGYLKSALAKGADPQKV